MAEVAVEQLPLSKPADVLVTETFGATSLNDGFAEQCLFS